MSGRKCSKSDFERAESFVKLSGTYEEMYSHVFLGEIVKFHAGDFGVKLSKEALQAFSNQARRSLGLNKKDEFDSFLRNAGADYDVWENACENELYRIALKTRGLDSINYIADAWPIIKSVPGVKEAVEEIVISKGKSAGIEIKEDTMQSYSDNLRRVLGLHSKSDVDNYFKAVGMNQEDWEKMISAEIYYKGLLAMNISPLTSEEMAINRRISDAISKVVSEIVFGHFVKTQSDKLSISVSEKELQNYLNDFRRANNLHDKKIFNIWLAANEMTVEDFEIIADMRIRMSKFQNIGKEKLDKEKIQKGVRLSVKFLEKALKLRKEYELIDLHKIAEPSEKEIQDESDALRRAYGLHNSGLFKSYLDQKGLSLDEWEAYVAHGYRCKVLRNRLANDKEITKYLDHNRVLRKMIKDEIYSQHINNQS